MKKNRLLALLLAAVMTVSTTAVAFAATEGEEPTTPPSSGTNPDGGDSSSSTPDEGNNSSSDVTIRRAAEECLALRASFCYLAHNHVTGIALPSPEDMNTTNVVRTALAPLGVRLVDHLVFEDGDLVSVRETAASGRKEGFRLIYPGQW